MFPILSYVFYRGKSRCCGQQLSYQHPLVEALTGSLLVWWYLMGSVFFQLVSSPLRTAQAGYWLVMGLILLVVLLMDLIYGLVPTIPVYIAMGMSVLYRLTLVVWGPMPLTDFWIYIACGISAFVFFAALHYGTKGRGMGMGDVILAPLLGLILGYPRTIVGLVLSFWIGALVGVIQLIIGKKKWGQTIPFAPFMVVGTLLALVWGNVLWGMLFNF
jgi:prepilin signal peptidase PulO-like enzyme (type II secretory pathway)